MRYQIQQAAGGLALIRWAHSCDVPAGCVQGDCFVVVRDDDDDSGDYGAPMTLTEIRAHLAACPKLLGSMINDCRGIVQGDRTILFDEPISVHSGT